MPIADEQARRRVGRRVADPVAVHLLIDTGTKRTTLNPAVLRHLEAEPGHDVQLITPAEQMAATMFWVRLEFPGTRLASFDYVQVARLEMPPALRHSHGLLGRDLLRMWDEFRSQGRRGRYLIYDTPGLLGWLRRRV